MKKTTFTFAAVLVLALPLLAQNANPTPFVAPTSADITWTCPPGFQGQQLNVYNWTTYIGNDTLADFERLCGVTVVYDNYDSNESLIARLRQGNPGYDVAFPTEYAVLILAREGLLQTIDMNKIPNYATNIPKRWKGLFHDPNEQYSVPYLWGSAGIGYNVNKIAEVTSWNDLFNYNGPTAWFGDPRNMMSVGLLMLGHDPNSTNPDEIRAARDYLLEKAANVVSFHSDDGQAQLEAGNVDMVVEYDGDVYTMMAECQCGDFDYAIPQEGAPLNVAAMVIPTGAQNPALAHVFIDYILDPVVGAMIVNDTSYPGLNQAAIDAGLISPELLATSVYQLSEEAFARMYFLQDVGEAEQLYNDAWDEIRILAGQ
ncbi:MAG: spermidine/putrescine ABC transporter substrate-binding protein [Anaerolineae bacterium]|nr:spermidine/putrescine ABC transporter substrate-binding protein [Anaerolineae bacterium]MDW8173901.1 spermidine/putrescine ABC transporter substrate-binding protein [Anaerolineae bacterium]